MGYQHPIIGREDKDASEIKDAGFFLTVQAQNENPRDEYCSGECGVDSEKRYQNFFEGIHFGIFCTTPDGTFVLANKALAELAAYDSVSDFLHSVDNIRKLHAFPVAREELNIAMHEQGQVVNYEYQIITGDKQLLWVAESSRLVKDSKGDIIGYEGVIIDISDKIALRQQYLSQINHFNMLAANMPGLIYQYRMSADGQISFAYASPGSHALFNLSPESIQKNATLLLDKLHPEDRETLRMATQHSVENLSTLQWEGRYLQNGEVRWIKAAARPERYVDGSTVWDGLLIDISSKVKESEEEQKRAYKLINTLFDSVPDALIVIDKSGKITKVNVTAEELFGFTPGSMVNFRIEQIIDISHYDVAGEYQELSLLLLDKYAGSPLETYGYKSSGEIFPATMNCKQIESEDGISILIVIRDLTDIKRVEADNKKMVVQMNLMQKMDSIGRLAAGIAHEINTPIQYIGDNIRFMRDVMMDGSELGDVIRELVEYEQQPDKLPALVSKLNTVQQKLDMDYLRTEVPKAFSQSLDGVERVSKIVMALKEFSHPGSEEKTHVNINHLIDSTVTVARNEWKYVAEMNLQLDPTLPLIPCLPDEFNQVILNLIINAAHAIAAKSTVQQGIKGEITISTAQIDTSVQIRVRDTGTGIPKKIHDKIFDPFFTTKPVGKGTGQGLAIAHSVIVEKHKGTLSFESEEGKGTTFIIHIPLLGDEA